MGATKDIIVVGAGPVGAMWASALAQRGHRVRVFERRGDMRAEDIGAGRSINLALSDRGFRALDKIGAGDLIRGEAIPMRGRMIHDEHGATNLQPYGEADQAIFSVDRGALNRRLMDHAEQDGNVSFHFRHALEDVDFARPAATFLRDDGAQVTDYADLVFGCDGAFSAVRWSMLKTPRFDYSQQWLSHGYKELYIPADPAGGYRIEKNALHIWPRGTFMLIALPNPDGSFTCTLFLPFEGDVSFAALDDKSKVEAFFAETFADAVPHMPTLVQDFFDNPTSPLGTIRCAPFHLEDKVCLLGDAAHAVVPFYGQGLNAGMEDCTVLSAILDETGEDWGRAFGLYSARRKPDADAIADLALYNFIEMRDRVADDRFVLQKKIEKKISQWYGDRYLPLYSMVTFSHRPYAEAQAYGRAQDALMQKVLALDEIEQRWDHPETEPLIRRLVDGFLDERDA